MIVRSHRFLTLIPWLRSHGHLMQARIAVILSNIYPTASTLIYRLWDQGHAGVFILMSQSDVNDRSGWMS